MYNHTIPARSVRVISQSPFVVHYRFEYDRTSDAQPPKYILVYVCVCVFICRSLVIHLSFNCARLCSIVFNYHSLVIRLSFTCHSFPYCLFNPHSDSTPSTCSSEDCSCRCSRRCKPLSTPE